MPNLSLRRLAVATAIALACAGTAASASRVITRADLARSGAVTVGEYLRGLPLNSFGSLRPSVRGGQTVSALALRGLGPERTLILLDGVRLAQAPTAPGLQDVETIPLASVERIEIETGGAAVLHGTGAVGGVVNIVTRRDLVGAELMLGAGEPIAGGGESEQGAMLLGIDGERGRLVGGVSFANREPVYGQDRPWSRGGLSTFSNNLSRPGGSAFGGFLNNPTFGSILPGFDCEAGAYFVLPTQPGRCYYDFTTAGTSEVGADASSLFMHADYRVDDTWRLYLDAGVNRIELSGELTHPAAAMLLLPGTPNHPATRAPDAGYDSRQPYFVRHRFAGFDAPAYSADNSVYRFATGAQADFGTWTLDAGISSNESSQLELTRGRLVGALAQQAITDGRYDLYAPFDVDPRVADAMTATTNREARYRSQAAHLRIATALGRIGGASGELEAGLETRHEELTDRHDSLRRGGQIIFEPIPVDLDGGRDVQSLFARWSIPVGAWHAAIGARHDRYDDIGSESTGAIELAWTPTDTLRLSASAARSHVAPSLAQTSGAPHAVVTFYRDPLTCFGKLSCASEEVVYRVANPDLESETADHYSIGLDWQVGANLQLSLEAYDISIEDRTRLASVAEIINCLAGLRPCPATVDMLPPGETVPQAGLGLGVSRNARNELTLIQYGLVNDGEIDTRGISADLRARFELASSLLTSELQLAYIDSFRIDRGDELAGNPSMPRLRARWQATWAVADLELTWITNHVDSTRSTYALSGDAPHYDYPLTLPSWTTHHAQLAWATPWDGRITVGVDNLFDRAPVLDPYQPTGNAFDHGLYDGDGRRPYVRYRQAF